LSRFKFQIAQACRPEVSLPYILNRSQIKKLLQWGRLIKTDVDKRRPGQMKLVTRPIGLTLADFLASNREKRPLTPNKQA
jgi:hypothetical protein